jgi:hypothetical protein
MNNNEYNRCIANIIKLGKKYYEIELDAIHIRDKLIYEKRMDAETKKIFIQNNFYDIVGNV